MDKGEALEESCAKEVVTVRIATRGASNFRNIVLVFKFKKKGIARTKLVPEAYFASNTFCLCQFSISGSEEISLGSHSTLQLNASLSDSKISDTRIAKQMFFILMLYFEEKMVIKGGPSDQFLTFIGGEY